jgi:exodeoxyribonuclease VII small subunit
MASFEDQLTQLEKVVEQLERGDLSLDDSVRLFEQGMKLSTACKSELDKADGRIQLLVEDKTGNLRPSDLALSEADEDDPDDEIDVEDDEDEE